jgi:hypothetical protein
VRATRSSSQSSMPPAQSAIDDTRLMTFAPAFAAHRGDPEPQSLIDQALDLEALGERRADDDPGIRTS